MRTMLRGKVTLLFMTLGLLIASAGVALASTVDVTSVVDVTTPTGAVTLEPGQSENITINMQVTGNQAGTATFEVYQDWTLNYDATSDTYSFAGSNPKEFTVNPRAGSDPATLLNTTGKVSVASGVPAGGPRTLTVGVFDITNSNTTGGKLEAGKAATYAVTVAAPSDTTAPKVTAIARTTASPTNTTGNLSWNVTFSENVTGVNRSDFQLVSTGLGGSPAILADPNGVTGSGANYTVTASSGSGDGSLGLNLVDDNTIKDGANNVLVGESSADGGFTGEVYSIDRTAPTVTPTAVKGDAPNFTGATGYSEGVWTNKDVQVTFDCEDNTGGSGLSATSGDQVQNFTANTSASGTPADFSGTCADAAGNAATSDLSFGQILIDKDAPVITDDSANNPPTGTAGPNNNGWFISAVTNTFKATDGLSGFLSSLTDPHTFTKGSLTAEGDAVKINSGSVSDKAGNPATAVDSRAFKIDLTNPTIQGSLVDGQTPPNLLAPASTGWYNLSTGAPTAHFACGDPDGDGNATNGVGSGVASCTADHTFGENANPQNMLGKVSDTAGRTNSTSVGPVQVDLSKPYDIAFQGGPTNGETYTFGTVPGAPTGCTASDAISGLKSCGTDAATTYKTTVGTHTITATAEDNAGNKETKTLTYTVGAWTLNGFFQPVDMGIKGNTDLGPTSYSGAATPNSARAGQTVPLKFEIFQGGTELTETSAVKTFVQKVTCGALEGQVDAIETYSSGSTTLRYDFTSGQYIFNWQTPKTAGDCYKVTMTAQDNSFLTAYFTLRK